MASLCIGLFTYGQCAWQAGRTPLPDPGPEQWHLQPCLLPLVLPFFKCLGTSLGVVFALWDQDCDSEMCLLEEDSPLPTSGSHAE